MIRDGLRRTGYDEVSLTSLSTADFSDIEPLIKADARATPPSFPARAARRRSTCRRCASTPSPSVWPVRSAAGRRSGLTFAPEAGSWRLRQVINKLITEEDLYGAVESAYSQGWTRMKLYFLTGLPTETDDDTLGIAELASNCVAIGKRHTNRASVTVSLGGFVPKPHTPFQWFGQNTETELRARSTSCAPPLARRGGVTLKWHDPAATVAEGIASRGDRRIGRVIERVWRDGGTFQEWGECFDLDRWTGDGRPKGCRSTGTSTATAPTTRSSRGSTSRQGSTPTSCGTTGRRRSPGAGSRTAAGRPAMTAGCAPATPSSTSSPRRCRRPAAARAPARTWPRGGEIPVTLVPRRRTADTGVDAWPDAAS